MIKAASLIYAILVSFIAAILCSGLVLIFNLNLNMENYFNQKVQLIDYNRSAWAYVLNDFQEDDFRTDSYVEKSIKQVFSTYTIKPWGVFSVCNIVTRIRADSVTQNLLLAYKNKPQKPALYLRDNDTEFKISGETEISGVIYISKKGLKKVRVLGNDRIHSPLHTGNIFLSRKTLPIQEVQALKYPDTFELLLIDDILETEITNTFDSKTLVIEVRNVLENIRLKGNIIIRSQDTLTIKNSAHLKDVIVHAPSIIYESGFVGNTQSFATTEIIVEEDANLTYPSILMINSEFFGNKKITIEENTKIEGAVLLYGYGHTLENEGIINIFKTAKIIGDVYCDGKMSLNGTILGTVIASSFMHKTTEAEYTNLLLDATIDPSKVPEEYFGLTSIIPGDSQEAIAIKQL